MQNLSFFVISSTVTYTLMSCRALLDLPSCKIVSQTLGDGIYVFIGVLRERLESQFSLRRGQMRTALRLALWKQWLGETIYDAQSQLPYLWDLEVQRGAGRFRVIIWGGNASHIQAGSLYRKGGFSAVLKLIVSLTGCCKRFYKIPVFLTLLLFYLFCIC